MSEDILLDFLQMECIALLDKSKPQKGDDFSRHENVGFDVGFRFIEKYTREWNRFKEDLEIIKFVCKEFWSTIFGKQADTLRTNHQGIYVLIDNQFKFLSKVSDVSKHTDIFEKYLAFSCGIVRGALSNLGIESLVTAEIVTSPVVRFQIQVQSPN